MSITQYERVTSRDNLVIKTAKKIVSSPKHRREQGLFAIEGLRLCSEVVKTKFKVHCLIVSESFLAQKPSETEEIAAFSKKAVAVPDYLFEKISDTASPQGILCLCEMPQKSDIQTGGKGGCYIALENLSDPANLGANARTAEAFAVSGIIVSGNGCDPYSPKAQRSAMGAHLRIPVKVEKDFSAAMLEMQKNGYTLYGAVVHGDTKPLNQTQFSYKNVILIGNEANGLTDEIISVCDERVTIPMPGRAESLNASVAAAIFMWEAQKNKDVK